MLATLQAGNNTQHLWMIAAGLGVGFLVVTGVVVYLMRKFFQSTREAQKEEFKTSAPSTENPSAFRAASMQGVIQQLREQEKELERLHRIERERAEQTERLSEEVTRNMPAGLLVVNATGIISSSNPAAEQVLGIHGRGLGLDGDGGRVPFDGEDFSARRSGAHSARGRYAAFGRYDLADPARLGEDQRSNLPADRFDGAGCAATTGPAEGEPGGAGRAVRGHRARVQECAGNHFWLCAADPGGLGKGCFGVCGAHPAADEGYYTRSGRIPEVREAAGDSG